MTDFQKWKLFHLGDLCRLRGGSAFKPALQGRSKGDYPFIKVSDFNIPGNEINIQSANHWVSRADTSVISGTRLPAGSTVFAKIGEALKHNRKRFITRETYIDNNLMAAVPNEENVIPEFLFQLFRTIDISAFDVGTSVPYVKSSTLNMIELLVPTLETQRRIASILGTYDDLIEVNRRRVAVLEEMARGLFEEWFVRFRFPGHETVQILDTPDGSLPEGWNNGVLSDIVQLEYGKALKADTRMPGPFPVFGSSGKVGQHNQALTKGPGIILGRKGNVGAVIWSKNDFWPIDTVYYVVSSYPLTYLYHLLHRLPFQNTDAAVPGLNRGGALKIPVAAPPSSICEEFDRLVRPIFALRDKLLDVVDALAASRDLLLPRLISGQLSVASAERELEKVA